MHNIPNNVLNLLNLTGQIVTLTTERQVKYRKSVEVAPTTKHVVSQYRLGVSYDNIKAVIVKRENGDLPAENQGQNGVEWVVYPHLLVGIKSGRYQMRCTTIKSSNPARVTYIRNGQEISREMALEGALASETNKERSDVVNVMVDSIKAINGVAV